MWETNSQTVNISLIRLLSALESQITSPETLKSPYARKKLSAVSRFAKLKPL